MDQVSLGCEHFACCFFCLDSIPSVHTALGVSSMPGAHKRPPLEELCLWGVMPAASGRREADVGWGGQGACGMMWHRSAEGHPGEATAG